MITEQSFLHTIDVKFKNGKYGEFYEITMVDGNGQPCVTYVDESFDNWWRWAYICKQPDKGFILKNLKQKTRYRKPQFTNEGWPIINADCLPKILLECDVEDLRAEVHELIQSLKNDQLFDE